MHVTQLDGLIAFLQLHPSIPVDYLSRGPTHRRGRHADFLHPSSFLSRFLLFFPFSLFAHALLFHLMSREKDGFQLSQFQMLAIASVFLKPWPNGLASLQNRNLRTDLRWVLTLASTNISNLRVRLATLHKSVRKFWFCKLNDPLDGQNALPLGHFFLPFNWARSFQNNTL